MTCNHLYDCESPDLFENKSRQRYYPSRTSIQGWQSEDTHTVINENILENTSSRVPTWKVVVKNPPSCEFVVILFFFQKSFRKEREKYPCSQSNYWRWLDVKEVFASDSIFGRSNLNYPPCLPTGQSWVEYKWKNWGFLRISKGMAGDLKIGWIWRSVNNEHG